MKFKVLFWLWVGFNLCFSAGGYAQSEAEPYAGQYELVTPPQPTRDPNKVEVVELFWYMCPHCFSFENYLKPWLKTIPDHVDFFQMPAVFPNDRWLPLAKAYYTAEILGVLEKVHHSLLVAIHEQKRKMNNEKALTAFFVEHAGVSAALFEKTFNSFTVDSKIRTAAMMTKNYGITGVPMVIVNGKYRLTSEKTNGYKNMMKVIDHLIAKEHKVKVAVKTHSPVTFK